MLSVFLSHNHGDKPFARRLTKRLKAHGIKVWLDEAEMQVGDSLISKIESAIHDCTYLGVILSPHSVYSSWVQREVNMALTEEIHGRRIKVLPLLQKECLIPGFLKDKLYADFTKDFELGFSFLLQRLNSDLHEESYKQKRVYEILQSCYQDWIAFSKRDSHLLDAPNVDLVLHYVSEPSLSIDLLEFLFASISFSQSMQANSPHLERLRGWIGTNSLRLLDRLLGHPNPTVRIGSLTLFGLLGKRIVSKRILRVVREETDRDIRRAALRTFTCLGKTLPKSLAHELIESDPDWLVQSYALQGRCGNNACLLVSDGSDFATEIGAMASGAGFHVVVLSTTLGSFELGQLQNDLLRAYSLVAVVRGEHFTQYGNKEFYYHMRQFVADGGTLFATSWVSWETKYHSEFAEVLPFCHVRDTYNEDVQVTCRPTDESFAQQLLDGPISYRTSFELLERKRGATVLLETEDSVPILGYRTFGFGVCYYLNTCQHLCLGHMESPLSANQQLGKAVGRLLTNIHIQSQQLESRTSAKN